MQHHAMSIAEIVKKKKFYEEKYEMRWTNHGYKIRRDWSHSKEEDEDEDEEEKEEEEEEKEEKEEKEEEEEEEEEDKTN